MGQLQLHRLGIQLFVALCLFTLAVMLFHGMHHGPNLMASSYLRGSKSENVKKQADEFTNTIIENKNIKTTPELQSKQNENAVKLAESEQNKTNKTRYLIYLCDRYRSCGGWSDRQRGLVSVYLLATVTGRKFGVNMSFPCDLKLFYLPNEVNWYIKVDDIRGLSWEVLDLMDRKNSGLDYSRDFNEHHPSDVVFIKTNHDMINGIKASKVFGHLLAKEYRDRKKGWITGWHQLMKPSFHFEEHVDMLMAKVPSKGNFICAHIRMGKSSTIPVDTRPRNSLAAVEVLWDFLSKYEENASRIFIATDSNEVRKSAKKRFGQKEMDTEGVILHIDKQGKRGDACYGFEIALLDQALLSRCNVLVVSGSGFSIRASWMASIKQNVFMFLNGTIKKQ